MEAYIQIITTTVTRGDAEEIARTLMDKRLAACVQVIGPVLSIYRWKGNIEKAEEWQCVIKSRQDFFQEIEKTIKAIHSYETPEIVATPITAGSDDYLKWLHDELEVS